MSANDYKCPETFKQEFTELTQNVLAAEIANLDELSKLTESIKSRLSSIYSKKFPKKCNNCQRVYDSMEQYIKETHTLENGSTVFHRTGNQVHQYQNCPCGSTLAVILVNRRDTSEFGEARRRLFDICVEKLVMATDETKDEIVKRVREMFRKIIDQQIEESSHVA